MSLYASPDEFAGAQHIKSLGSYSLLSKEWLATVRAKRDSQRQIETETEIGAETETETGEETGGQGQGQGTQAGVFLAPRSPPR